MMRRLFLAFAIFSALASFAQINIWEGMGHNVKLTPYLAEGVGNMAVVVCPGGSYFWHDTETEGTQVAQWLQANGISAFVLDYRTAKVPAFIFHHRLIFRGNRYPDPQDDLKQAIKLIRERATDFGIDPTRVGAMGFSAGGHLVMSAAEMFEIDERPNFIVPIYPVVTMTEECAHKRSRRGLLGDNKQNDKSLRGLLSLERHVPEDCPPVFLVNCVDDPIVDYRNSVLLDSALSAKGVPHAYLQFSTGGHGFGASDTKGSEECRQWKARFLEWIKEMEL